MMTSDTHSFAAPSLLVRPGRLAVLALVSFVIVISNILQFQYTFVCDSRQYLSLAASFIDNGSFRLSHFDSAVRGYLFPLLLLPIAGVGQVVFGSPVKFLVLCLAPIYAAFLTIVFPRFVHLLSGRRPTHASVLLFSLLMVYFWRGYFYYPLTDLPALMVLCVALIVALKYFKTWWGGLMTGILMGAAALIRPNYQIVFVPLVAWIMYFSIYKTQLPLRRAAVRLALLVVGVGLIYLPQLMINVSKYRIASPFVQTQLEFETDLFTQQLAWGMELQKYETNIGDNYPAPHVRFLDRQGEGILFELGLKSHAFAATGQLGPDRPFSRGQYSRMVFTNPVKFLCIYLRHLFNGMDLRYDTPYIPDVFACSYFRQLMNYSIWFVTLSYAIAHWTLARRALPQTSLLAIVCLPALVSIPTAVEVRFMLPLQILCYMVISFFVLPECQRAGAQHLKRIVLSNLPYYLGFVLGCFLLSANTYMELQYLLPTR